MGSCQRQVAFFSGFQKMNKKQKVPKGRKGVSPQEALKDQFAMKLLGLQTQSSNVADNPYTDMYPPTAGPSPMLEPQSYVPWGGPAVWQPGPSETDYAVDTHKTHPPKQPSPEALENACKFVSQQIDVIMEAKSAGMSM